MEYNLHTTVTAYPLVSPSILDTDYVKKTDLTETLEEYVKEAPKDGNIYARMDGAWDQISDKVRLVDKQVYYGESKEKRLCTKKEIESLRGHDLIDKNYCSYDITYDQREPGFFWIVCTYPILDILWMKGSVADYIRQIVEVDNTYFCYRIAEPLLPGIKSFKLVFSEEIRR